MPVLGAFAGTPEALDALDVTAGPGRWLAEVAALRPELDLDRNRVLLSTWRDDPWVRGAYSAPSASSPLRPDSADRVPWGGWHSPASTPRVSCMP